MRIGAPGLTEGMKVGDSVAVDGVCLTVVEVGDGVFSAEAVRETLRRTTLGKLRRGDRVNLERALSIGDRRGGHIRAGHVDGVGRIVRRDDRPEGVLFAILPPRELMRYIVPRGSVGVDGVSLTVVDVLGEEFSVSIIPHTLSVTTFGFKRAGDQVNIEVDLLARYVEGLLSRRPEGITQERLKELGFR